MAIDWAIGLPTILIVLCWLEGLRRARRSAWGAALLSIVGTVLHEMAHLLVGALMLARPTSFSIFPKRTASGWVLGSVGFRNLNILNAGPVAFAPLLLAGVTWAAYAFWAQPAFSAGNYLSWLLSGYVMAVSLFSSIPSATDIRLGARSGLLYGAIGYGLWVLAQI